MGPKDIPQGQHGSIEVKENIPNHIGMVAGITRIMEVDTTREEAMNHTKSTSILTETLITFFTMCIGQKIKEAIIGCRMLT